MTYKIFCMKPARAIKNTMKYTQLIQFKDDYEVTSATTVEEAKQILAAGFDYIT